MSDRPSDGMELDELRDEFDWMYEFQSRMAERIRGDAGVHNLVDYVGKLESENAELRRLVKEMRVCLEDECKRCHEWGDTCDLEHQMRELGIEMGA